MTVSTAHHYKLLNCAANYRGYLEVWRGQTLPWKESRERHNVVEAVDLAWGDGGCSWDGDPITDPPESWLLIPRNHPRHRGFQYFLHVYLTREA